MQEQENLGIKQEEINLNNEEHLNKVNSFNTKTRKRRLRSAFTKMMLMAMLLIVSTYAWFTSQRDITISNLRGTVEVAENMEISLDAKTWHQRIDLSEAVTEFTNAQTSKDRSGVTGTAKAILPSQLLPVSAVGEKTETIMPLYEGKAAGTSLKEIEKLKETDASGNVVDNGYFAFDIYIKNTSKDGEDDILQLNLNSAVKVLANSITKEITENGNTFDRTYTGDAASGLQNTVRVGLALYGTTAEATATQAEILTATKSATVSDIAIWEPNSKDHVEYIVANNNKLTDSANPGTDLSFDDGDEVTTYALSADAVTAVNIENVYNIRSTGLELQNTFKTEKASAVDYRVKPVAQDGEGKDLPLNIESIDSTDVAPDYFTIKSNKVSRLRVYVWLEGQDVDCINLASQGGGIDLDLGFTKDNIVGEVKGTNFATKITGKEATAYGQYTDYPIDIDGNSSTKDWRIFYNDGDNVFLIADDYLPTSLLPSGLDANADGTYGLSWRSGSSNIATNNDFLFSAGSVLSSGNFYAYNALEDFLKTELWDDFVDDRYADKAIGTPTLEMWVESWNDVNGEELYYSYDSDGYYIGTAPNPTNNGYTSVNTGNSNTLYYPRTSVEGNCVGYWLAAPWRLNNESMGHGVVLVTAGGTISAGASSDSLCGGNGQAIRPVVMLDSETNAIYEDGTWQLSK